MLVLSSDAEDERRAKILTDVEAQITSGGGTLERNDDWHTRPLAYEINHQTEGEYHLLQFTGPTALLEASRTTCASTTRVLRFRIIKVLPGTPPAPDGPPVVAARPRAIPLRAPVQLRPRQPRLRPPSRAARPRCCDKSVHGTHALRRQGNVSAIFR